MSVETQDLNQNAVYYAANGFDGNGDPSFATGLDKKVRWEYTAEEFITDPLGNPLSFTVKLFVDFDPLEGSRYWKGLLADVPSPLTDLYIAVGKKEIPDLDGLEFQRTILLAREKL